MQFVRTIAYGDVAQLVEHPAHNWERTGSIPVIATITLAQRDERVSRKTGCSSVGRVPASDAGGRGIVTHHPDHHSVRLTSRAIIAG